MVIEQQQSATMSAMQEEPIVAAQATVMIYDDVEKKWIPAGSSAVNGIATVYIYHNTTNRTFRVIARKVQDHEVVINCTIPKGLKYNQATATFHQWRDQRQVYGLNFKTKEDADTFAAAMAGAVAKLNKAEQTGSVTDASGGQKSNNNQYETSSYGASSRPQNGGSGNGSSASSIVNTTTLHTQLVNNNHQTNGGSNGYQSHLTISNGDMEHDIYGRGKFAQNSDADHYSPTQKESSYSSRPEWSSASSVNSNNVYHSATHVPASHNNAAQTNAVTIPVAPTPNRTPAMGSAPAYSSQQSLPSKESNILLQSSGPPVPPPAPPTGRAPPAPPPPPPVTGINTQANPLANALANAQLRKTGKDNGSIGSTGSNGSNGGNGNGNGNGGGGQHGLISEMQATLARRRAKQDRTGAEDISYDAPSTKTTAGPAAEKKGWGDPSRNTAAAKLQVNGNGNGPGNAYNSNNTVNGPESPKMPRKVLSFSGTSEFDSTRSSNVDALDGGSLTLSDLERVKQEILTEMRREMQKWKIDLIEAVRQELSGRR